MITTAGNGGIRMVEYITNEYKKKPLNTAITGETGRMGRISEGWLKNVDEILEDYLNDKMSRDVALARLMNIGAEQEYANAALDQVDKADAREK